MNEIKVLPNKKHEMVLVSRNKMTIDGVSDVISFDENEVDLITSCGEMTIEGRGLHISTLDVSGGRVELDGEVDGIYYPTVKSENEKPRGFFSRVFG